MIGQWRSKFLRGQQRLQGQCSDERGNPVTTAGENRSEQVKAEFKNGLLRLTAESAEEACQKIIKPEAAWVIWETGNSGLSRSHSPVVKIQDCGYKADERPTKFRIGDKVHFVEFVEDQWRGVDALYFRVHADDGNSYILRYTESTDAWSVCPLQETPPWASIKAESCHISYTRQCGKKNSLRIGDELLPLLKDTSSKSG